MRLRRAKSALVRLALIVLWTSRGHMQAGLPDCFDEVVASARDQYFNMLLSIPLFPHNKRYHVRTMQ